MNIRQMSLAELAKKVEGEVLGDENVLITGFSSLDQAKAGDITFIAKVKGNECLVNTAASAILVPENIMACILPAIKVKDPYLASAIAHNFFLEEEFVAKGIHPRAWVGEDCQLDDEITVMANATIGDRVRIGARTVIYPGVCIGNDVVIGDDCTIHANVTIEEKCLLGNRVILHAGTVIGSDGFGYVADSQGRHIKRPQVGIVVIGDDVEMGANCCVDRATFGITEIKSGSKFDNLVQVAHNVDIGENCILVAQVGIAGSTRLGRNVVLGGKVAVGGHLTLEDGVMVAGRAGVHSDLSAGAVVGGFPAIPIKQWRRSAAIYGKLPELRKEVRRLEKDLEALKNTADG